MEKVVEYFHYWYKNRYKEDAPDMDIPAELCLELLVAADFLGLDSKQDAFPAMQVVAVAHIFTAKSKHEIRRRLTEGDISPGTQQAGSGNDHVRHYGHAALRYHGPWCPRANHAETLVLGVG